MSSRSPFTAHFNMNAYHNILIRPTYKLTFPYEVSEYIIHGPGALERAQKIQLPDTRLHSDTQALRRPVIPRSVSPTESGGAERQ
jgi:hypothetical protein